MARPRVSVIIPVYNVASYIGRCVHALFGQTLGDMELIFVDDCSPDDSVEIIRSVLKEYPNRMATTRIIRHGRNSGVAAARTTGMKAMTGEYMAQCDPDDFPEPDMYRKMYATAKEADADVVSCMYVEEPGDRQLHGIAYTGDGYGALLNGQFTFGLWDKIIRTEIIKNNDIYPYEGINYNEDLGVIVRALCHSFRVIGIKDALYHHTVDRKDSICNGNYKELLLNHSVPCLKLLDEYLDLFGRNTGDSHFSSRLTDPVKFWMKNALYTSGDVEIWRRLWPESRRAIHRVKSLGKKERMLMSLFAYTPSPFLRLLKNGNRTHRR